MASAKEILQKFWGYESFRPLQEEIIESVVKGKDTLALLPTGGGKSICFQVPGLMLEGLTIVISPLIALMKDQVERLNQMGIAASYLNSQLKPAQIDRRLQDAMDGKLRFLYIAPERIDSDMFQMRLEKMPLKLLVVDEAHCISQWGYDFRKAYLNIAKIREIVPDIPIIAVTASATQEVQYDIQVQLGFKSPAVFRKSFKRDNLRYFVLHDENVISRILEILNRTKGSGIIYARTRRSVDALTELLQQHNVSVAGYHGGMMASQRSSVQEKWLKDQIRVIIATNAFGMGIDKPDCRFVIHYNMPFDLESYYQEAGRGGRDGETALAISFLNPADMAEIERWVKDKYPTWEELLLHYKLISNYYQLSEGEFQDKWHLLELAEIAQQNKLSLLKLYRSLQLLHKEGLIYVQEDKDDFAYIQVLANPEAILIYKEQHPKSTDLLDQILRSLGGDAYRNEKRIKPGFLAKKLDIEISELDQQLQRLDLHAMIAYRPARSEAMIRFQVPRQQLNQQTFNWSKYTFLQKNARKRLKALKQYAENTEVCRSLLIQNYFGENTYDPCGKCDVCIGRFKTKVSKADFRKIKDAYLQLLKIQQLSYRDAIVKLSIGSPPQKEKVLRHLLEKSILQMDPQGIISLS